MNDFFVYMLVHILLIVCAYPFLVVFVHLYKNHGFIWSRKIILCLVIDVILIFLFLTFCISARNKAKDNYYHELADEVKSGDMDFYAGAVYNVYVAKDESAEEYNPEFLDEAMEALCDYYYRADDVLRNFRQYEYQPE